MPDRGPRNSSRLRARCTHVVNRSFEHPTGDRTIWLDSAPILRENTQGPPISLLPTSLEDLRLDGYLKCPPAAKELYICQHLCPLRDSNPDSMAQQSASLTTIPDRWL
ncbi:uncharacterized protein TNCV_1321401 [Trichonephila clavipes]|nr:uncharacterized protein TNCV_1321401 [Trichonephila clavipes]